MKAVVLAALVSLAAPPPEPCALDPEFSQQESASSLRVRTSESCRHPVVQLVEAVERGLADARAPTTLRSIFIGRLISYPELSESLKELAASDAAWDRAKGKGQGGDNAVVARLLHRSPNVAALRIAIERHGYRLKGFSVEKVLVTSSPGTRLPFDAMTWLIVERP